MEYGSARTPTGALDLADRPNAWIDRRYRRGDLPRNAFAANFANSTGVDDGTSPGLAVQKGQPTSGLWNPVPTARNSESRVGSDPARARPEWQRTPRSNTELALAASVAGPSSKTGLLDP